ncbi:MAG: methionine biosynthesis protein MetW [Thermodesulfobacteriota bacterium]|nr:methionine biosynthesis protein MetW [Thermodesulfobacteriota bacterium]
MPPIKTLRYDLQVVASWIPSGAKVLGLGCGEGDLLYFLKHKKQVNGSGIEKNEARVAACIEKGLTVLQGDINEEIIDYPDDTFDFVICTLTLQQVYDPADLISAMLRIGKKGIVSFPNFSHWRIRWQLLLTGNAPKTKQLPYEWYNTPNIRVITLKDFRKFARKVGIRIVKEVGINTNSQDRRGTVTRRLLDWRATYGIFMVEKHSPYSKLG